MEQKKLPATTETAGGKAGPKRKPYEPPRILMTEKLLTLSYTCHAGPYPVSAQGCPP
jgi:hypothetical protein